MPWFPENYMQSIEMFERETLRLRMDRTRLDIDGLGPNGQRLTIEIASHVPKTAKKCIVHIIGVHGVEGYPGSAVQNAIFQQREAWPSDIAVYFIHPFNPYGMAWIRRVNGKNVDLNRNYIKAGMHPPENDDYAVWSRFLNPRSLADTYMSVPFGVYAYFSLGRDRSLQAIAQGQYLHDEGLFFGGLEIQQELKAFQKWMNQNLRSFDQVWVLDVHSGLGKYAEEILFIDANEAQERQKDFESLFSHPVTLPKTGAGHYSSYGALSEMIVEGIGAEKLFYILQEFGTYNEFLIGWRMRREKVVHFEHDSVLEHSVKREFLSAFCPQDSAWREQVIKNGVLRFDQILGQF